MAERSRFSFGRGTAPAIGQSSFGMQPSLGQGSFLPPRLPTQNRPFHSSRPSTSGASMGSVGFTGNRPRRPLTAGALGGTTFSRPRRDGTLFGQVIQGTPEHSLNRSSSQRRSSGGFEGRGAGDIKQQFEPGKKSGGRTKDQKEEENWHRTGEREMAEHSDVEGAEEDELDPKGESQGLTEILRETLDKLRDVPDELDRDRQELTEDIAAKDEELSKLEQENQSLQDSLDAANRELDEFSRQEGERIERFEEVEGSLTASTETIEKLELEIAEAKKAQEVKQDRHNQEISQKEKRLAEISEAFENEVKRAKMQEEERKSVDHELKYVRNKIEHLLEASRANEAERTALNEQLFTMKAEKEKMEQSIADFQRKTKDLVAQLENRIREDDASRGRMNAEISTARLRLKQSEEKHSSIIQTLDEEKSKCRALHDEVLDLEGTQTSMKDKLTCLVSLQPLFEELRRSLKTQSENIEPQMHVIGRKLERGIERFERVSESNVQLSMLFHRLCSQFEEARNHAMMVCGEKEGEKMAEISSKYEREAAQLQQTVATSEDSLKKAEQARKAKEEEEARTVAYMIIEHEAAIVDLNDRHTKSLEAATETERKLVAAHSAAKMEWEQRSQEEIGRVKGLLHNTTTEREKLKEKLSNVEYKLKETLMASNSALETAENLKKDLEQRSEKLEADKTSLEKELSAAQLAGEELRRTLQNLAEEGKKCDGLLKDCTQNYDDECKKVLVLSEENKAMKDTLDTTKKELARAKCSLLDAEANLKNLVDTSGPAKQQAEEALASDRAMKEEVSRLQAALSETEMNLRESAQLTMNAQSEKHSVELQFTNCQKKLKEEKLLVENLQSALRKAHDADSNARKTQGGVLTSPVLDEGSTVYPLTICDGAQRRRHQSIVQVKDENDFFLPPGGVTALNVGPEANDSNLEEYKDVGLFQPANCLESPNVTEVPNSTNDDKRPPPTAASAKRPGGSQNFNSPESKGLSDTKVARKLDVENGKRRPAQSATRRTRRKRTPTASPAVATPDAGSTDFAERRETGKELTMAPRKAKRSTAKRPKGSGIPLTYGSLAEPPQVQTRTKRSKTAAATVIAAASTLDDDDEDWLVG